MRDGNNDAVERLVLRAKEVDHAEFAHAQVTLVPTPRGDARLTPHLGGYDETPTVAAVILHGAGTDTAVPMLVNLADSLAERGVATWRLDQPYTLGARRPPAPAAQLDTVATTVIKGIPRVGKLFLIGRSSGARVACRTAETLGAAGIVALGFPLIPPGRPTVSRADELANAGLPVTVLQGSRDAFGGPAEIVALKLPNVVVHEIAGADHGFETRKKDDRLPGEIQAELVERVLAVVLGRGQLAVT